MDILRVNITKLEANREPAPPPYEPWGGRGLIAKILSEEVQPTCDPLGAHNKLIFAPGLLAGRGISSAGRLSLGGKSPLTGGIKESNVGGMAGDTMARLGLKAIVVEGQLPPDDIYLLQVGRKSSTFIPAADYRGLGNYALAEKLQARYGKEVVIISTGPAGESRLAAAGVAATDADGNPGRLAARGGLGAVMGAKGLKAILLEDGGGRFTTPINDRDGLREGIKRYVQALREDEYTSYWFPEIGTPYMVQRMQKLGGLPTHNFRYGNFDDVNELVGETIRQTILSRNGEGKTTHACMRGCVVRCSNIIPDEQGRGIVSPLDYESMIMLGPNLGIGSLDTIAHLNRLCNDCGLDTIEIGAAIGVAMEAGVLPFGDGEKVAELLNEVARGTILGRVLGQGAAVAGRVLGVPRTPTVKGQAIAAYDPRAVKGMGVTYATSPMGADHTAGHTADAPVDHHSPEGQVDLSRGNQITAAAWDTLGLCAFVTGATIGQPELILDLLRAIYGGEYPGDYIRELGKEVLRMERTFNRAAGFTSAQDRFPGYFRTEKLPPYDLVFDVPDEELDKVFDFV